jgi:hypothetical protein
MFSVTNSSCVPGEMVFKKKELKYEEAVRFVRLLDFSRRGLSHQRNQRPRRRRERI